MLRRLSILVVFFAALTVSIALSETPDVMIDRIPLKVAGHTAYILQVRNMTDKPISNVMVEDICEGESGNFVSSDRDVVFFKDGRALIP